MLKTDFEQLTTDHGQLTVLFVCRDEPVADVDHRFDVKIERREAAAEAIDVDVEALGVEGDGARPGVLPEFFGSDDALWVAREAREEQKLFTRELERVPAARDIIIVVLDAQTPVVVHTPIRLGLPYD